MVNRFRVSTTLAGKLQELGVPPAEVLRRARLPERLFEQDKIFVSTEELFALYGALTKVSRDPTVGLKLGGERRVEQYDPIALAALSARSFRDALGRLARYKQLVCPEELRLVEGRDECRVQFKWLLAEEAEPDSLIDVCFAVVLAIARRGTGEPITPKRVQLRRDAAHRKTYEAHFGCPISFDGRENVIVFHKADLDRPFVTRNPDLVAAITPQLEAELAETLASRAIGDQVRGTLKRLLAGRRPGIEEVARELRLSPRTLQRRLSEEGFTFQALLQEARRELARHYLLHSSRELDETAYLLGYEDAPSFFRAFQQWEGTSPGEWRARHGSQTARLSTMPA